MPLSTRPIANRDVSLDMSVQLGPVTLIVVYLPSLFPGDLYSHSTAGNTV